MQSPPPESDVPARCRSDAGVAVLPAGRVETGVRSSIVGLAQGVLQIREHHPQVGIAQLLQPTTSGLNLDWRVDLELPQPLDESVATHRDHPCGDSASLRRRLSPADLLERAPPELLEQPASRAIHAVDG